jgi:hypothetical protein
MPIKNYTSGVPVEKTILRIEMALIQGGAIGIMKDYSDRRIDSISFSIPSLEKRLVSIRLPANVDAVYDVLFAAMKRPRAETLKRLRDQAERTAWKLVQDWVEIQMAMIKMQQVEFIQVFLPYIWDGKQTFYASLKEGGFKQLTEGKPGRDRER